MTLYRVYDNGKLADHRHIQVDSSWMHPLCETFEQAQEYAKKWLGKSSLSVPDRMNQPEYYSGCGDIIEIRAVEWNG